LCGFVLLLTFYAVYGAGYRAGIHTWRIKHKVVIPPTEVSPPVQR
jgi:hypothetical protein